MLVSSSSSHCGKNSPHVPYMSDYMSLCFLFTRNNNLLSLMVSDWRYMGTRTLPGAIVNLEMKSQEFLIAFVKTMISVFGQTMEVINSFIPVKWFTKNSLLHSEILIVQLLDTNILFSIVSLNVCILKSTITPIRLTIRTKLNLYFFQWKHPNQKL